MKFLNIVLFSQEKHYQHMKQSMEMYYKTFSNLRTIYCMNDPDLAQDCCLKEDIFYMKDKENYIPAVLTKTIKTFTYIIQNIDLSEFDYIIRSNISTIIDFHELEIELSKHPVDFYAGGNIMELQWVGGGIEDSKHFGTLFAQGSGIVFTKETVQFIVKNQHLINYKVVDDVSLAIFLKENWPNYKPPSCVGINKFLTMPPILAKYTEISKIKNVINEFVSKKYIFYRTKRTKFCI